MSERTRRDQTAWLATLLTVVLVAIGPIGMIWLQVDNAIEHWTIDDASESDYTAFQQEFGASGFLLLAYEAETLFDDEALDLQLAVLDRVEAVPGVVSVQSLPSLFRDHFGAESGEELEAEIESSPFYDGTIVAEDRGMAGMLIETRAGVTAAERRACINALREAAAPFRDAGWPVNLVGPDAVNAALDVASDSETRRMLPFAVVLSSVVLWLQFRSGRRLAIVAAISAAALATSLGIMGWLGLTMNMVTVALPPVLWVLSTAYTVYLIRYYDTALADGLLPDSAATQALRHSARPSLLAALTTAAGFLALLTSGMAPVRELGIAAAMGIAVALTVTIGLAPCLLRRFVLQPPTAFGAGLSCHTPRDHARWARPIVIGCAISAIICIGLTTQVRVESNPLAFLDPSDTIVRDSEAVAAGFTGLYALETVVLLPSSWLEPANWPAIEAQVAALAAESGVARVLSPLDYLRKLNQWAGGTAPEEYRLPTDRKTATALLADAGEQVRTPLDALVSEDGAQVRLSALVTEMDGGKLLDIVRASEAALAKCSAITGYHTGIVLRLVQAQFALIETQLKSLGIAVCIVFVCVAAGLRSKRLLLLSVVPNLLPVLAVFGIMGAAGIPLDPATVMVAAMALGIAVDDTMHLLVTWQEEASRTGISSDALQKALYVNGPAMTTTTLVACAGFIVLGFSSFAPIRYFGLLSAAAMAVALAADRWLLPALMQLTVIRQENTP